MALTITKSAYKADSSGVTNTATAWKVTSDIAGLLVMDTVSESTTMVNQYFSTVLVTVETPVYVWYKMRMSNNELKDWVGPIPYVNRQNNVTNIISPIARVETPILTLSSATPIDSNIDTITINTSRFRGDEYDGLESSTWYIKADGKIIYSVINDEINKTSLSVSKQALMLGKYSNIIVGCKHQSSNNGSSEFGMLSIDLSLYPFTFVGATSVSILDDYTFSLVNKDTTNAVYISSIILREVSTNNIVYQNDTPSNTTVIARTIFDFNTKYKLELTIKHSNTIYASKMTVLLTTKAREDVLEYDVDVDYDFSTFTTLNTNTIQMQSNAVMMQSEAIVKYGTTLKILFRELGGTYITRDLGLDATLSALVKTDIRAIKLDTGDIITIVNTNNTLKIYRCRIIDDVLTVVVDTNVCTIAFNGTINIENNITIGEGDDYLYLMYLDTSNSLRFVNVNVLTMVTTILPSRVAILAVNYKPDTLCLVAVSKRNILCFGGEYNNNKIYKYDIIGLGWTLHGLLPDALVSTNDLHIFRPDNVKLKNRTIFFTNAVTINSLAVINKEMNFTLIDSDLNVTPYDKAFIRPDGVLHWIDTNYSVTAVYGLV